MDKQELLIRATLTIYGLIHGCARIPHNRISSIKSIIRYVRMTIRNEI